MDIKQAKAIVKYWKLDSEFLSLGYAMSDLIGAQQNVSSARGSSCGLANILVKARSILTGYREVTRVRRLGAKKAVLIQFPSISEDPCAFDDFINENVREAMMVASEGACCD